jgi:hypothetical protein
MTNPTPCLTIREPWASACIRPADRKDVENRTWHTPYRGRIAIHAGASLDKNPRGNPTALERAWGRRQPLDVERGVIIGTVRLVDCHIQGADSCECDGNVWAEFSFRELGQRPTFHWIFAEPREFVNPLPAKGALQLWQPGPSLAHLIEIAEVVTR